MVRRIFEEDGYEFSTEELRQNESMPSSFTEDYVTKTDQINALKSVFQAFKEGTKLTSGSYTPLFGWDVDVNTGGYELEVGTGEITVNTSGEYVLSVWVLGDGGQLSIKAQRFDGSSWVDLRAATDTNDPSVRIDSYSFGLSLGEKVRILVAGDSVSIGDDKARITLNRKT